MPSTVFVDRQTPIMAAWLNDVNTYVYENFANVKYYGAKGDGVTDDTQAFFDAIATGRVVYVPFGTYVLTNNNWPAYVSMFGDGIGKSVLLWQAGSAASGLMRVSGYCLWDVSKLTIDSNRQNQTDTTGYYGAISGSITDKSRLCFKEVEFKNGRIADVYITGPTGSGQYAEVKFDSCRFYDGLVGDATRAAQAVSVSEGIRLTATNNVFEQPSIPASYGRGGLVMQRPGGSTSLSWGQVIACGNSFTNFGRGTLNILGCVYVYSGSELSTVSNNVFKNSIGTAITIKSDCGNTTITGNTVHTNISSNSGALCFFDQADSYTTSLGRNLVIVGNTVYNAEQNCYFVDGSRNGLSDFTSIVIDGNIADTGLRGIHYRNVDGLLLTNNYIKNVSTGIFGGDCTNDIVFSNNVISDVIVGIDVIGTTSSARITVSKNKITNCVGGSAVKLRSSVNTFTITDNEITVCTNAIETVGASGLCVVTGNLINGETTVWSKSGTYSSFVVYRDNITSVNAGFTGLRSITIASGAITICMDWHWVDTEGAAGTDDLDTINGGYEGRRLVLMASNSGRDVVVKDGTGNIRLSSDFTLTHADDMLELIYVGGLWKELTRSDNTA